jgi:short-subunit dehydrogenase
MAGTLAAQPRVVRRGAATPAWPPRTAVVTGATSGIGRAVTARLCRSRCRILAVGRDEQALFELEAGTLRREPGASASGRVLPLALDLTVPDAATAVATRAADLLGPVDLLVACAGQGLAGPFASTDPADIRRLVEVNVTAPLLLTRALLPALTAAGGGRIVLVGSIAGMLGVPGEAVYSATKAAVAGFASALRSEVGAIGVSVTLAVPGVVDTAFFARRGVAYDRRRPRPLPVDTVAAALLDAAARRRPEVWTPRWLGSVARLQGAAPATYRRLAGRFG